MNRIFILTCSDGSQHAFDDRGLILQSLETTYAQFGQVVRSSRRHDGGNIYTLNGVIVAYDTVMILNDRRTHL